MKNTVANGVDSSLFSEEPSRANVALMSIKDLQVLCGENAKKSGWHADRPKLIDTENFDHGVDEAAHRKALLHWQGMKIMLMVSELAEGVEELRAGRRANETHYPTFTELDSNKQLHKPEGLPSELADTMIRILDFCYTEEIDLQGMIQEKLEFNQTRGQKHGGKAV